jgi:glycerophosphoryl diester phosphodiesterase
MRPVSIRNSSPSFLSKVLRLPILMALLSLTACNHGVIDLDVQGHRGCRGLMPENSLPAFEKAWESGATTFEMDVVITRDSQVVVSHEAWFSHEFCSKPDGTPVTEAEEKQLNIYQMDYADVLRYDCGKRGHPRFPEQQKVAVVKPLLSAVIEHMEEFSIFDQNEGYHQPKYSIELKTEPGEQYGPPAKEFVRLVLAELAPLEVQERCTMQSFDLEVLREVRRQNRTIKVALLVEEDEDYATRLSELGYYPEVLSPAAQHVDEAMLSFAATKNMTVIPWTVNEPEEMRRLIQLGVHGIITDYPDRLVALLEKM